MNPQQPNETVDDFSGPLRRGIGALGDAAMPAPAFEDLTVSTPVRPLGAGERRRGHGVLVAAMAAAAALAVGVVIASTRDEADVATSSDGAATATTSEQSNGPTTTLGSHWIQVAPGPLSPRTDALVAWTGDEVLVVGGQDFWCPPTASCVAPPDPPDADGAAYDPATDSWRPITPAPVPFADVQGVVVDGALYVITPPETLPADEPAGTLLRYDIAGDEWSRIEVPGASTAWYAMAGAGDRLLLYSASDEALPHTDLLYDPATQSWTEMADDPLGPSYARTMVTLGDVIYLFDHPLVSNPGSDGPSLTRVARYDIATDTWTRGADGDTLATGPWLAEGSVLINPLLGCADGGETNGWGRCVPNGGVYDTAADTWAPLPDEPGRGRKDIFSSGAIGSTTALVFGSGNHLYDAATRTWTVMPSLPSAADPDSARRVFSIGADAFVFGGASQDGMLREAWIWHSGRR